MNAGALGLLTHQSPYQFHGLEIISTVFYVFDLTLFIVFSVIFILRFTIFRSSAYREIVSQQTELTLCACWPIAFLTLTSLTPVICSNAYWGRHAFTILGYVMWWSSATWSLLVLFWVFITLIRQHDANDRRLPTTIILPAVSVATVAVTGGSVVSLSYDVSPRLAVPVIVVSFMMVGIGILLGLMLSTYLFHAFLAQGWPAPAMTASTFILVGPMGQSAAALLQLGMAAREYGKFGGYNKGSFLTAEAAVVLETACVLIALILAGLGVIWSILAIYAMIERALQRKLFWTPGWNAIIFPMATLTTSMNLFAVEMDSPAFRVITVVLIIVLLFVFLLNLAFTIWKVVKGELLIVKEDWRGKKQLEERQKEK